MTKMVESTTEGKYRNKYRVPSTRLQNYDYGQNGMYFVTVCTQNRECFLGEITSGEMKFSEMGKIIETEWAKTSKIRTNVILDEWVVMPNHFHGIVVIENNDSTSVETHINASLQPYKNKFGPQSHNLSSQIHLAGFQNFAWQSRFHEHIVRNERTLGRIREYIVNNSCNWETDELFVV